MHYRYVVFDYVKNHFSFNLFTAPSPAAVQTILATKCLDLGKHKHKGAWFYTRDGTGKPACDFVSELDDPRIQEEGITANQVVFTFQVSKSHQGNRKAGQIHVE